MAKRIEPPTLQECIDYARENELLVDAEDFFKYFEDNEWHDSEDKPVKRWKGKMRTWHSFAKKRDKPRKCAKHGCKKPGVYVKGADTNGHKYFYCHWHKPLPPKPPKEIQEAAKELCKMPEEPKSVNEQVRKLLGK